jgi:hypothetical protein
MLSWGSSFGWSVGTFVSRPNLCAQAKKTFTIRMASAPPSLCCAATGLELCGSIHAADGEKWIKAELVMLLLRSTGTLLAGDPYRASVLFHLR